MYGLIRAKLEQIGQVIDGYDMQIAAQALSRNLVLVTNNTGECSRIRSCGLKIGYSHKSVFPYPLLFRRHKICADIIVR
jgi:hypothetical protein